MTDNENRRLQMFERVRDFGVAHARDFADNSLAGTLFTTLTTIVTDIENHAASEVSGKGLKRQGSTIRSQAREALREDLEAIKRTAEAMSNEVPGLDDKFKLPPNNDQLLLSAARAFITDATPLKAQFIAHEMPEDFLAELDADITALETAITQQSSGLGDHVAASVAIDTAIDRGIFTVRRLDAIVKNRYSSDASVLAEWTSASHTQRAPRSKAPTTQPPSPSAGGGSAQPPA